MAPKVPTITPWKDQSRGARVNMLLTATVFPFIFVIWIWLVLSDPSLFGPDPFRDPLFLVLFFTMLFATPFSIAMTWELYHRLRDSVTQWVRGIDPARVREAVEVALGRLGLKCEVREKVRVSRLLPVFDTAQFHLHGMVTFVAFRAVPKMGFSVLSIQNVSRGEPALVESIKREINVALGPALRSGSTPLGPLGPKWPA